MDLSRRYDRSSVGDTEQDVLRPVVDESHYRAIFDHSLEAVLLTAPDGRVLAANAEACKLFGREPHEICGLERDEYTDADDARVSSAWAIRQRAGRFTGIVTMRRGDGSRFEADMSATLFEDTKGIALSYIFLRDVTERERASKALLASDGNVLIGLAPGGMILEWNREAERVYGFTRREVLGKDYFALFVDAQRRPSLRNEMKRALTGETLRYREEGVTSRGGDRRVVLWSVTRLLDMNQQAIGVIASGQDVTERKQLEQQMQHAQKLESLGVLAGGIAHDFNNLLVGILGNASLALMDLEETSPLFELVKDIETTALRAADLTKQMLAYSGRGRFVVRPVDLSSLVEEMAHLLQTVISKRAQLQFAFTRPMPEVEADATQLRQIVMNLITNASDALNGENGTITLRTGLMRASGEYLRSPFLDYQLEEGTYAYVEVQDSGIGMSAETMQRIFDPFFSTKFTGRGLGLAATLGIVRGHRGTIRVTSIPGEGTTFRVLLPTRAASEEATPIIVDVASRVGGSGTILVVDDDPTVRAVATQILERRGFSVVHASDGAEGLQRFVRERASFILAFVDLAMPQMGGDELIHAMRAHDPDFPVILMSGFSEVEIAGQFAHESIAGFVQKPFRVEEFDRALERALAR
jgi:two-component system, cell cycle sensor histidine kinase and response regulator CckA